MNTDPSPLIFAFILSLIVLMSGSYVFLVWYDQVMQRARNYEVKVVQFPGGPAAVQASIYLHRQHGYLCRGHTETLRGLREVVFETDVPSWALRRVIRTGQFRSGHNLEREFRQAFVGA